MTYKQDEFNEVVAPLICAECGREYEGSPFISLCRECAEIEIYEEGYRDGKKAWLPMHEVERQEGDELLDWAVDPEQDM